MMMILMMRKMGKMIISKKYFKILSGAFLLLLICPLFSVSLQEKRESLTAGSSSDEDGLKSHLKELNSTLKEKKEELLQLNIAADAMIKNAPEKNILELLSQTLPKIEKAKAEVTALEHNWKELSKQMTSQEDEALWHQPDTTIGQLVIDYGSVDHVYLMPPEIANLKIHISSQLTVPRASWNEMLELILASYGIGVKQLNTFTRQLFFLRLNQSNPTAICESIQELQTQPLNARVLFILTPPPTEVRRIFQFLEKFVPQEQVNFQMTGSNIVMVGTVRELLELSKIYSFLLKPKQTEEFRLVALQKAHPEEVAQILQSIFNGDGGGGNNRIFSGGENPDKHLALPYFNNDTSSGFRVIAMKRPASSLFLMGKPDQIEKAADIIKDIENKIGEVQEKTVYWYACRHSEAEELAKVLANVYQKMVMNGFGARPDKSKSWTKRDKESSPERGEPQDATYQQLAINPPLIGPSFEEPKKKTVEVHDNFIVDPKTNSIVMVVETYLLEKLKDLAKTLDVPKKMVELDILMIEKKVQDSNSFGMNLLKLANAASKKDTHSLTWNDSRKKRGAGKGILNFALSRKHSGFMPAYDIAFNFLLQQQDVRINANPTVTTINQTAAKIAFVDEISINTGVVEIDTTKATRLKNSYVRAQYGITIQITPTIHSKIDSNDESNDQKFITLSTDIEFDTPEKSRDDRPDIIRRNIKNEVRVADGETIILGGLRRKMASDDRESIPFLGELPGVGKFFSTTNMNDTTSEMFIFITPRIVPDPSDEMHEMRRRELIKRPGDLPEFLQQVELAKQDEKKSTYERSMKMLFGRPANPPGKVTIP